MKHQKYNIIGQFSKINISQKIVNEFKNNTYKCVYCSNDKNKIIIVPKNFICNDENLYDIETQTKNDFHLVCVDCVLNIKKARSEMLKTKKRPSALDVPIPSLFGIAYTKGDEKFDENDPNWGIGCYWYDPIQFIKDCIEIIKQ